MKEFSWIHLSDFHIYNSTDLNIMLDAYRSLAKEIKPDFLIITGDFRHKKYANDYDNALNVLNKIVDIFQIEKQDVFLVPGNHDVNDFKFRKEIITTIRSEITTNPDIYLDYIGTDAESDLHQGFEEYNNFVNAFYGDTVKDQRTTNPSDVICVSWRERLNIILLNTALLSRGKPDEKDIVDINALSKLELHNDLPSIIIAHHDLNSIVESHNTRLISIINNLKIKAFLCGHNHKISKASIDRYDIPNTTIPIIVCGKSVIEMKDDFSDLRVILYTCNKNGITYVQGYKYQSSHFVQSSDFYYDINKPYNFRLYDLLKKDSSKKETSPKSEKHKSCKSHNGNTTNDPPISIWLPDAEYAQGKQTRFYSFTTTKDISKFFDPESRYLGIVSVKGIGKTFVLQVKRVQSSRKYYCLPRCSRPSPKNNWATECVSFDKYIQLKTNNIYDNLVLLWKISIKCYVLHHLLDDENLKTIYEYMNKGKLSSDIAGLIIDEDKEDLNSIISNIVCIEGWDKELSKYSVAVNNICIIFLKRRKKNKPNCKDIAIFIDKVDQSIKQTNAEPPADCVLCPKRNNYNECNSLQKSPEFCSEEKGCKSKNCCYGCEIFAGANSNEGLRIYENSNTANRIHVNIWQYLQLALMHAAEQLSTESRGEINVFYTIRQEAFNCEGDRLGEQNQKIAGKTIALKYTMEDQKRIFYDCIRAQDPYYLFDPSAQHKEGREEYAFVGVSGLCHPYCRNDDGSNQKESLFMTIYRHSFDRSRDIQQYGEALTKIMNKIRECETEHRREELVKNEIEDIAASLAYCSKQSESTVNPSYYTEKMRYLPNYWADNDNFERLLSLIDRNLLFEQDIKVICRKVNECDTCPTSDCRDGTCKRHPFSVLYNMGYLGYIKPNKNNTNSEIQQFLDACEIGYFVENDELLTTERVAYILHPALTKTIEKKYNKSFMHFKGFILGKGLSVDTNIVEIMIKDKNTMDNEDFISKYYYKPSHETAENPESSQE